MVKRIPQDLPGRFTQSHSPYSKRTYFSLAYFLINEFLSPPAVVLNDLRILDFSAFKMHFRNRLADPPKGKPPPRNR
jgi:hypothetical protein